MTQFSKIHLRPFRDDDVKALQQFADNPKISATLRDRFPYPYTIEHATAFIGLQTSTAGTPKNLVISTGEQLIGVIGIIPQEDIYRFNAEIGYWIAEEYWGKGIATEAVKAMAAYVFTHFEVTRLFAGVFEHNTPSMRVLEKAGFRKEAVHLKKVVKAGKVVDEHSYALLKEDWIEAGGYLPTDLVAAP